MFIPTQREVGLYRRADDDDDSGDGGAITNASSIAVVGMIVVCSILGFFILVVAIVVLLPTMQWIRKLAYSLGWRPSPENTNRAPVEIEEAEPSPRYEENPSISVLARTRPKPPPALVSVIPPTNHTEPTEPSGLIGPTSLGPIHPGPIYPGPTPTGPTGPTDINPTDSLDIPDPQGSDSGLIVPTSLPDLAELTNNAPNIVTTDISGPTITPEVDVAASVHHPRAGPEPPLGGALPIALANIHMVSVPPPSYESIFRP